jgi:hypothetical protein
MNRAENKRAFDAIAAEYAVNHPSDEDLERYHLGTIRNGHQLAGFDRHLTSCPECVMRSKSIEKRIGLYQPRP